MCLLESPLLSLIRMGDVRFRFSSLTRKNEVSEMLSQNTSKYNLQPVKYSKSRMHQLKLSFLCHTYNLPLTKTSYLSYIWDTRKQVSMARKCHNTDDHIPTHSTAKKRHRTLTAT